jgi:hypothetical protein
MPIAHWVGMKCVSCLGGEYKSRYLKKVLRNIHTSEKDKVSE